MRNGHRKEKAMTEEEITRIAIKATEDAFPEAMFDLITWAYELEDKSDMFYGSDAKKIRDGSGSNPKPVL